MSESASAFSSPAEPAATKKTTAAGGSTMSTSSKKSPGPSVSRLIVQAVANCMARSGISLPALKKALAAGGYDVERNNSRLKTAVKSLVSKGSILQVRGTGASGSFKINKKMYEAMDKPRASETAQIRKPSTVAKPEKPPIKKRSVARIPRKAAVAKKRRGPRGAKSVTKATRTPKRPKAAAKAKKVPGSKSPAKKEAKPKRAARRPANKEAKPKRAARRTAKEATPEGTAKTSAKRSSKMD